MKKTALALALSALAMPTLALDAMPTEKGFSGFVNLGAGGGAVESNFLARISGIGVDLSDDTIDSLDSPDDKNIALPSVGVSAGYTFSSLKTRVSVGNDLYDFLQFDRATLLAVRHDFDSIGNIQLGLLSSSGIATEVWADPYKTGEKRKNTDFRSTGGRITWDKMFGSQFELKASAKEVDIDDENSGSSPSLGLSAAQRKLLDREGDVSRVELGYVFNLQDGKHLIRPSVTYIDRDLDGDAMSQDGYGVGVSYIYSTSDARWVNNLSYASMDGDKVNPIFNEVNDADRYGVSSQLFFPGLFGLEKWTPNIGVAWAEEDSDVDFNDSSVWVISAAMFRRF
jgi:hypothetical protein